MSAEANNKIDAARIDLAPGELRLSGIKLVWAGLAATADHSDPKRIASAILWKAGPPPASWPRSPNRRWWSEAGEGSSVTWRSQIAAGQNPRQLRLHRRADDLEGPGPRPRRRRRLARKGRQLLCFGPPGGGKPHLAAGLGLALVEKGWRVLFTRTTDLVQKLQIARRDLALEAAIAKLDKYHLLILDDLAYVTKDQAETSVLFELISSRYERRSMLITANQPFGEWGKIFPGEAMTLADIDRLVHHATILEMNVDSYRRREAIDKARGIGRPPTRATIKASS
jgi:hypothetical protein